MSKINYNLLMEHNPTQMGEMTNSINQQITFYENPVLGDSGEVICVCHELQLAANSSFYETSDMTADHQEYEPKFIDGEFWIGDFKN